MQISNMESSITLWLTVFMTIFFIDYASIAKKLEASQAFDDSWNTASDLENELEQKRNRSLSGVVGVSARGTNIGTSDQWSRWSDWSTCSRSCDGGIMQQIRRCRGNNCRGENVRFRICNMQACPELIDFRARQCAAFDDVPYDGTLYKWTPHYDYLEPCALTCRGRPAHLVEDISVEAIEDSEHYEEPSVIVQLSSRVQDGTRCRSGSLDMCIQGKCQRVGCDLKIGSTKKIDSCGICGGDGNTCSQALHQWETSPLSQCSVSCGGGYKMSRMVCRNRLNGAEVNESLCNASNRPEPSVSLCNTHTCPPRWVADDWSPCSRLCGQGYRERMVVCAEEKDGIKTRVADMMCESPHPPTQEPCLIEECPKWEVEEWTACSVSCGKGIQMRGVECKSNDGSLSAKCDPLTKPSAAKQCNTGISCDVAAAVASGDKFASGTIIVGSSGPSARQEDPDSESSQEDEVDEDRDDDAEDGEEDEGDDETDFAPKVRAPEDPTVSYAHLAESRLYHEEPTEPKTMRLMGNKNFNDPELEEEIEVPTADPTFIKDTIWSPCSVTCGEGIRRRAYKCKIFLEYSRTIATVNDTLCEGAKPQDEVERCVEDPCTLPSHGYDDQYPRDSIKVGVSEPGKTYVWREQGYTSCSASCLGGVEELIINCVREDNGRVVSPFLCAPESKPEARVRTCNDRPCPPRWNYSDYTPCSKSCGIGIKTREIQCIHEVTRGGENTMVVPNSMCPQPPPADRQYCNVLDCPVRWEVGEWSKCSHTCGYGFKERKVECKQIMAQEHKIERPESLCPSVKPSDKKPCNIKPCPPEDPKPIIQISNTTHIQHDPKKSRITLKIGGAGVVFFGTQVKIKCPVKRYNRTKIKWSKDHKPLERSRRFKVSKKGALRILDISFMDAGVYSCHAGLSSAEISIEVKPKPGQQMDELKRQESERLVRERSGIEALTSADMTASENGSRQQQRNRRPKPTADNSVIDNNEQQQQQQQREQQLHQQTNLITGTHDGLPQPASASSGGSRHAMTLLPSMPYFEALINNLQSLWPLLQRFRNSHGQQLMLLGNESPFFIDFERYEQDEPAHLPQQLDSLKHLKLAATTTTTTRTTVTSPLESSDTSLWQQQKTTTNTTTNKYKAVKERKAVDEGLELGHNALNARLHATKYPQSLRDSSTNITYEWHVGAWSACTPKCDKIPGKRAREVVCLRHAYKDDLHASLQVNKEQCLHSSTPAPKSSEVCALAECPVWQTGSWTPCKQSRCLGRNIAMQKRDVHCQFASNGSDALECDHTKKPINRKECYNPRCKGVWRVEPWSECNAPCGLPGIKYRILQCVWYGTRRPAGNACKNQSRPVVMKACKRPSCSAVMTVAEAEPTTNVDDDDDGDVVNCVDTSRYCRNVRVIGLCRLHRYQQKCCKSCKINNFN